MKLRKVAEELTYRRNYLAEKLLTYSEKNKSFHGVHGEWCALDAALTLVQAEINRSGNTHIKVEKWIQ